MNLIFKKLKKFERLCFLIEYTNAQQTENKLLFTELLLTTCLDSMIENVLPLQVFTVCYSPRTFVKS